MDGRIKRIKDKRYGEIDTCGLENARSTMRACCVTWPSIGLLSGARVQVVESSVAYGVTRRVGSPMFGLSPQVAALLWGKHLRPDMPSPAR
jgi:hypothetical protein